MQKYLIAGLLVAGMVSPAFAAEFLWRRAQAPISAQSRPRSRTARR